MAHHALAPPPYGERRARDEPALLVGEPGDDPGSVLRLAIARNCHEASLRVGGWAVGPVHLGIRRSWMHHIYGYAACPRSRAKPLVRPTSAALLRLRRPSSGPGTRSARLLPIEMMRPPSPGWRAAACAATNAARVDQLVFCADCARLRRVSGHVAETRAAGLAPRPVDGFCNQQK